jgi:hypothetical protein
LDQIQEKKKKEDSFKLLSAHLGQKVLTGLLEQGNIFVIKLLEKISPSFLSMHFTLKGLRYFKLLQYGPEFFTMPTLPNLFRHG